MARCAIEVIKPTVDSVSKALKTLGERKWTHVIGSALPTNSGYVHRVVTFEVPAAVVVVEIITVVLIRQFVRIQRLICVVRLRP